MSDFLRLAKEMLRDRAALVGALLFALLSAAGLGLGLLAIPAVLKLILTDGDSLPAMATRHNDAGRFPPIPSDLVARLPADPMTGVMLIMAGVLVLTALGAAANFMHQYLTGTVAARTVGRIRQQAFDHAAHRFQPERERDNIQQKHVVAHAAG